MNAQRDTEAILLVDDEPSVLKAIGQLLKVRGYKVFEANSAEAAALVWSEHAPEIDLLLADVTMPGISGLELANNLRVQDAGLKVILMSGYMLADLEARFNLPYSYNLLEKPFSPQILLKMVGKGLKEAQELNHPTV